MTDAPNHVLIPKHTKITKKEAQELLRKYNITQNQLPKISKNDAAIKHLEVEPGDIIKIERESPTSGKTVFYRVVINE